MLGTRPALRILPLAVGASEGSGAVVQVRPRVEHIQKKCISGECRSVGRFGAESVGRSVVWSVGRSVSWVGQSFGRAVGQSLGRPVGRSVSQSVGSSVSRAVGQSFGRSVGRSIWWVARRFVARLVTCPVVRSGGLVTHSFKHLVLQVDSSHGYRGGISSILPYPIAC